MDDVQQQDLSPEKNGSRSVNLDGRELLLVCHGGEHYLYENRCPHTGETLDPLGGSILDADAPLLVCQRHGAQFLLESGECVGGPCQGESLAAVPCTVVGQDIYLD